MRLLTALLVSCAAAPAAPTKGQADGVVVPSSGNSTPATAELVELPPPGMITASATPPRSATPTAPHLGLTNPARAALRAPEEFTASFATTAGVLTFKCERKNAPVGVDRFFSLINIGYFKDVMFFRVVTTPRPFVIQFGIHAEPRVNAIWRHQKLAADPVVLSNTKGTLTFAQAGAPDTRTTQLFINLADNTPLDKMGFAPVCKLSSGETEVNETTLSRISSQHGERPSSQQEKIQTEGNAFLNREFPNLDFIMQATTSPSEAGP